MPTATGVAVDGLAQGRRRRQALLDDVPDRGVDGRFVDGAEIAQHAQHVGGQDADPPDGREVPLVPRTVHEHAVQVGAAAPAGHDDLHRDHRPDGRCPTGRRPTDGTPSDPGPVARTAAAMRCSLVTTMPGRRATPGCTPTRRPSPRARNHVDRPIALGRGVAGDESVVWRWRTASSSGIPTLRLGCSENPERERQLHLGARRSGSGTERAQITEWDGSRPDVSGARPDRLNQPATSHRAVYGRQPDVAVLVDRRAPRR